MDVSARVGDLFDRLVDLSPLQLAKKPVAEQFVFYVVAARCQADLGGWSSVFEQIFQEKQLELLVEGLSSIGEAELARAFQRGNELLRAEKFYDHLNWSRVSAHVRQELEAIGEIIGDRLWSLDNKVIALVDAKGISGGSQ